MTDSMQKPVVDLIADVLDELCGANFRGVKAICQRASQLEGELNKHREFMKAYDEVEIGGNSAGEYQMLLDKLTEKREALGDKE